MQIVNTVFGPMAVLETDVRIGHELKAVGMWDLREITGCIRVFEQYSTADRGTILDIGCNVGAWLLPIHNRYPNHTIHAFDCQEPLIDCLDKTLDLNNITNVTTHLMAATDYVGDYEFATVDYRCACNFGAFELETVHANPDFNGRRVPESITVIPAKTIDSFCFEDVQLIKLDVEGMEFKVITGALETLQRCRPMVIFENHKCDYRAVLELFDGINYQVINTVGQMSCAIANK